MAELARESKFNLDISSEFEVQSWVYGGVDPVEVISRVDLGIGTGLLAGAGGQYSLLFYINNVLITPSSIVDVPIGRVDTIMVSRPIPLEANDTVSIRVEGRAGDISVNTVATLRDATPAKAGDFIGDGTTEVDHDFGGVDELAYKNAAGIGIDNATLRVYRASDYAAGRTGTPYVVAASTTDVNGRWKQSLMLDPEDYVVFAWKQGAYGPDTKEFTVTG